MAASHGSEKRDQRRVLITVSHRNPHGTAPLLELLRKNGYSPTVLGEEHDAPENWKTPEIVVQVLRPTDPSSDRVVAVGGMWLDPNQRRAWIDGDPLKLTKLEFDLLTILAEKPGRVFSRELLIELVWDYSFHTNPKVVDAVIKRLRKKLSGYGRADVIEAVRGIGYRMSPPHRR